MRARRSVNERERETEGAKDRGGCWKNAPIKQRRERRARDASRRCSRTADRTKEDSVFPEDTARRSPRRSGLHTKRKKLAGEIETRWYTLRDLNKSAPNRLYASRSFRISVECSTVCESDRDDAEIDSVLREESRSDAKKPVATTVTVP